MPIILLHFVVVVVVQSMVVVLSGRLRSEDGQQEWGRSHACMTEGGAKRLGTSKVV